MDFKVEEDFAAYLNLDQFASPALANINKGKGLITPQFTQPPIEKINTYAPLQTSQTFSGPSHQYGQYKQHIPLPPGALANSLAAARPIYQNNFAFGSNSGFFGGEEFIDFAMDHRGSQDMDMDFDSPLDFNTIGHEEDSPVPAKAEIVRVYPGMHAAQAQQAALAKQQQQMEIQRQQQIKRPSHKPSASKASNKATADPVVEERISRLLNQMRQSANVPVKENEDQSPPTMRSRKDEEDMDEDERLLASEEGKKLSSKERRQLRNKVSARAFRSRRKEYIGQLEGEVAQKSNEADTLRAENEALKAENIRLTDLTKLLLSSAAFSTFLEDLSVNGLPPVLTAQASVPASAPAPVVSATPQSEQQSQHSQFSTPQMNTIIEDDIDFNALDSNASWNSGMDFSFAPQVFAVTELPEGPVIDSAMLSGKRTMEPKETVPVVETAPAAETTVQYTSDDSVEFDQSDPAFSLFADSTSKPIEPTYELFGTISFEKATETYDLIIADETQADDGQVSASTMCRFEQLCSSLDMLSLRLDGLLN